MDRRLFVLASLALCGCATARPPSPTPPRSSPTPASPAPPEGLATLAELEPIYSAVAGPYGVTIRVASNGCATTPDFAFYVERRPDGVTIAFARKRLALCRSHAKAQQEISFSWVELGLAPGTPVFFLNPLLAGPGTGS